MKKIQVKINGEWKKTKLELCDRRNYWQDLDIFEDIRLLNESEEEVDWEKIGRDLVKNIEYLDESERGGDWMSAFESDESECEQDKERCPGCEQGYLPHTCKPKIEKLDMRDNNYNYDHDSSGYMFSNKREIISLARKINEIIDHINQKE